MKNLIIFAAFILLGVFIYGLITGNVQTAISDLLGRSVVDINGVAP